MDQIPEVDDIDGEDSDEDSAAVKLTSAVATLFVGGQIEIQNPGEGYIYHGEIAAITVEGAGSDATLKVVLKWMAKGEGYPPLPERWVNDDDLEYGAGLLIYSISDIGNGRLCLESPIIGELVVLFPPGVSNFDPAKVAGLIPSSVPEV